MLPASPGETVSLFVSFFSSLWQLEAGMSFGGYIRTESPAEFGAGPKDRRVKRVSCLHIISGPAKGLPEIFQMLSSVSSAAAGRRLHHSAGMLDIGPFKIERSGSCSRRSP